MEKSKFSTLDEFKIIKKLGEGGFAKVALV